MKKPARKKPASKTKHPRPGRALLQRHLTAPDPRTTTTPVDNDPALRELTEKLALEDDGDDPDETE
jgi:hypothetical protein